MHRALGAEVKWLTNSSSIFKVALSSQCGLTKNLGSGRLLCTRHLPVCMVHKKKTCQSKLSAIVRWYYTLCVSITAANNV